MESEDPKETIYDSAGEVETILLAAATLAPPVVRRPADGLGFRV